MIINKTDRRARRTEQAIRMAFAGLIVEKGYDNIQVIDIAERADIGRGTYYLHYEDKQSLLAALESEVFSNLSEIIKNEVFAKTDEGLVHDMVVRIFQYLADNIEISRALFGANGDCRFQKRMRDMLWKEVFSAKFSGELVRPYFSVPPEYVVSYVKSSHFSVFETWLEKEDRELPEEIARIILDLSIIAPGRRRI